MSDLTEVTAGNLRYLRRQKDMNQDEVAELLGLQKYHVSNIETGRRTLTPSEKSLLDWFFFGKMPPQLATKLDLKGTLEFTEEQWQLVEVAARRAGSISPKHWIRSTISNYLEFSAEGKAAKAELEGPRPLDKVADDEYPYPNGTEGKASGE